MLKLGDKNITKLYYGDKAISKAYYGDKLVYQAGKPVFLDYVIFDGDSYIDTGLKHESCRIETAVKYEAGQSRRMLTGWSGAGSYWGMMSNGKLEVSGSGFTTETDLTDYTTLEIVLDNENLLFTVTADNATKTVAAVYANSTYTIGCTTPSSVNKIIGNVYYHRVYNTDNVLIQDLRPCIHPTTKQVGFYDLVTNQYFFNAGTGTLKAGGRFVESIIFDGASYIDTGIISSNNMEFEVGVMFSVVQSTNLSIIASRDSEKRYQPIGVYQNKWSASIGTGYDANGSSVFANTKYDLRSVVSNGDSISLYSENTLVSSLTSSGGIPTNNLYLFARNYSPVDSYVTGRLYYCKIWNDGTLIQDLRPYVDSDGVACFKDVVTNTLFYNQGTGTLGYTEE